MQKRRVKKSQIDTFEMFKLLITFTTFTMACFFVIMYGVTGKFIY